MNKTKTELAIEESNRNLLQIISEPFAWPGGYEVFAIMDDGECMCYKCCESERHMIEDTYGNDGWCISALHTTDYLEDSTLCCNCGKELNCYE